MDINTEIFEIPCVITQEFGEDFKQNGKRFYKGMGYKGHMGTDFRCKIGTPIKSLYQGIARVYYSKSGYGNHITIYNKELQTLIIYGHLSKINIKDGEYVDRGDKIGETGNSGDSTGPHLHFGLQLYNGKLLLNKDNGYKGWIDPIIFFNKKTMEIIQNQDIYKGFGGLQLFDENDGDKNVTLSAYQIKQLIELGFDRYEKKITSEKISSQKTALS